MVWANQDFFSAHRVPLVPDARRLPGSGLLKTNKQQNQTDENSTSEAEADN